MSLRGGRSIKEFATVRKNSVQFADVPDAIARRRANSLEKRIGPRHVPLEQERQGKHVEGEQVIRIRREACFRVPGGLRESIVRQRELGELHVR
jgi:hypothetical protein